MNEIIRCENVSYAYSGHKKDAVLSNINFSLHSGELVAILGTSGSGKSTLLNLMSAVLLPTSGKVSVAGVVTHNLNEKKRSALRANFFGNVYQFHYLLMDFSALENVMMPLLIKGMNRDEARGLAISMLDKLGLVGQIEAMPASLSGGERQRVGVARGLVGKPICLLADEPTGNLDHKNSAELMALILSIRDEMGLSGVVVTHDEKLSNQMNRVVVLEDGHYSQ